jgi:hypothetical protein
MRAQERLRQRLTSHPTQTRQLWIAYAQPWVSHITEKAGFRGL